LTNVGANSNYWSSSPLSSDACQASALNFTSGNVNPFNTPGRAWANSVRCVQHLPAALQNFGFV